jgi:maleate isomerase
MQQTNHSLYHSRIPFDPEVTPETLAAMESDIPASVSLFPATTPFRAIGYGCTSGATVIGADNVATQIQSVFPDVHTTDPISAALAAFSALGARKIGLLTPYRADVSAAMRSLMENSGFEVTQLVSFDEQTDSKVARISEDSVKEAAIDIGNSDCDLVFSSCTNLRSFSVLEQVESVNNKPMVSSNSALGWHLVRLAQNTQPLTGIGRLGLATI